MAATVSLIQMLASGMVDSTGTPIASGKARFYQPGTLTPVTVYSDTAGASAITPPLTLTAGGTGVAYTQNPTRLIVKDSLDVTTLFDGNVNLTRAESLYIQSAAVNGGTETTLQTLLNAWSTAFRGSAGLFKYKATASATERNPADVIAEKSYSVKDFGAVGNGVADDTTAIQAAVTAAQAAGGGTVLIPSGTYLTSAAITVSLTAVNIVGMGPSRTRINGSNGTQNGITISVGGVAVRDLSIYHATSSSGIALSFPNLAFSEATSVWTNAFATGISIYSGILTNCAPGAGGTATTGLSVPAAAASTWLGTVVIGGSITGATGASVTSSGSLTMLGTRILQNVGGAGVGVDVGSGATFYGSGVVASGGSYGLQTATDSGSVSHSACNWDGGGLGFGGINDRRTGAPVAYSFGTNSSVTPALASTDVIRIIATAAITVTVNNPLTLPGFGKPFRIICINNSGGAVTWAFGGAYKLVGGAAPAPATGNYTAMTFEPDPVSGVYRESQTRATAAI